MIFNTIYCFNNNPIFCAIFNKNIEIVKILISNNDIDLNVENVLNNNDFFFYKISK